jgi:hypothetical protein
LKKIWFREVILGISRSASQRAFYAWLRAGEMIAAPSVRGWTKRLGLERYAVSCQPTHPLQVTGPDGRPGHEVVGVIVDGATAKIVHTRPLREDDIVHELLHVARPEWPHVEVELWTELLTLEPALAVLIREGQWLDAGIATDFGFRFTLPKKEQPIVRSLRKEFAGMKEVTAYNLKTKKQVKMLNPELVTLKNGRKALRGLAGDDGKTTVVKILSAESLAEWEKA